MSHPRIAIIGAGIAGASAAYFLARQIGDGGGITLLEQESQPGYHTTGRSATIYSEVYGNAVIRGLVKASHDFMASPDGSFAETSILSPRSTLMVANANQIDALHETYADLNRPDMLNIVDTDQCLEICPVLRRDYVAAGIWETAARDIDVHALHQGYLKCFRSAGGQIKNNSEVLEITPKDDGYLLTTGDDQIQADIIINAAGAWGDHIARLAGAEPVGLKPLRRTAITIDPPAGIDPGPWPLTFDVEENWYFKPDAGRILASPADETLSDPCDAQPEELDIAICIDRLQTVTELQVRRIESKWAGLRSFVGDKTPVNGFDDRAQGFYWLVGQGGYGIKTSPAMGALAAANILGTDLPQDFRDKPIDQDALRIDRLRNK